MAKSKKISLIISAKDAATKIVGKVQQSFTKLGDQVKKLFGPTGLIAGGLGALGIGAGLKSLTNTASDFENLRLSLETVTGSAEKAQKALDFAASEAAASPYTVLEYAEAYKTLAAYGIDAEANLRTLGDTASAMGKPLSQAVEAFADAMQGEGERLKEFGIKQKVEGDKITYTWVDGLGKVRQTIAENNPKIIEEALRGIWNEKYAGGMAKFANSWSGLTSTAKSLWQEFVLKIADSGPFQLAKNALQVLIDKINQMKASGDLTQWATTAGEAILKVSGILISSIPRGLLLIIDGASQATTIFSGWKLLFSELSYQWATFMESLWGGLNRLREANLSFFESTNFFGINDDQVAESRRIAEEQRMILSTIRQDKEAALRTQQEEIGKQKQQSATIDEYRSKVEKMQGAFDSFSDTVKKTGTEQSTLTDGIKNGNLEAVASVNALIARYEKLGVTISAVNAQRMRTNAALGHPLDQALTDMERTE